MIDKSIYILYKLWRVKSLISVCEVWDRGEDILHVDILSDITKNVRSSILHEVLVIVKVHVISMRAKQDTAFIVNLNDGGPLNVVETIQEGRDKGVDGSSVGLGLTVLVLFFCPYPSQIPVAVAVAAGIWNPFPCAFCIIYDGANGFGFVAYSNTDWDGDLETC